MTHLKLYKSFCEGGDVINESNLYKSDIWKQIDWDEKESRIGKSGEEFTTNEIDNIRSLVNSIKSTNTTDSTTLNFRVSRVFVGDNNKQPVICIDRYRDQILIHKLSDEWYILSYVDANITDGCKHGINILCDQMDSVKKLIGESISDGMVKIPFDYYQFTPVGFRNIGGDNENLKRECLNLVREEAKSYGFRVILQRTSGVSTPNSIKLFTIADYSDISREDIEFFGVSGDPGKKIIYTELGVSHNNKRFLIRFTNSGPTGHQKNYIFACRDLSGVRSLLSDKLSNISRINITNLG